MDIRNVFLARCFHQELTRFTFIHVMSSALWDPALRATNEAGEGWSLMNGGENDVHGICTKQWLHIAEQSRMSLPEEQDDRHCRPELDHSESVAFFSGAGTSRIFSQKGAELMTKSTSRRNSY